MTTTEILNWIAKSYTRTTRSIKFNEFDQELSCLYFGPEGRRCAISAMCVDTPEANDVLQKIDDNAIGQDNDDSSYDANCELINPFLKPEFAGHSKEFYIDCQALHDSGFYWAKDNSGLSEGGKKQLAYLIKKHKEQDEDNA